MINEARHLKTHFKDLRKPIENHPHKEFLDKAKSIMDDKSHLTDEDRKIRNDPTGKTSNEWEQRKGKEKSHNYQSTVSHSGNIMRGPDNKNLAKKFDNDKIEAVKKEAKKHGFKETEYSHRLIHPETGALLHLHHHNNDVGVNDRYGSFHLRTPYHNFEKINENVEDDVKKITSKTKHEAVHDVLSHHGFIKKSFQWHKGNKRISKHIDPNNGKTFYHYRDLSKKIPEEDRLYAMHGDNNLGHAISIHKKLNEDAPTNNVGSGNVAGVGVGPQGEPGKKNMKGKPMKRFKNFIKESKEYFGIGDLVKLHHKAAKEHGHKFGLVSAIGGRGDNKGKVEVHLKKSPLNANDHVKKVPIHMSELKNLTKDPASHLAEIGNHIYHNEKGFRHGDKVIGIGYNRSHGEGIIHSHNEVNGRTLVAHGDKFVNHNPGDLKKI